MKRLFVTTIESIKTPTGQDGFRIILSDGSELAGVRDVTVNATESGVMTAYFAVGGEFKVVAGLAFIACDHKWMCCGASLTQGMDSYICCKCDETKLEPSKCEHAWVTPEILHCGDEPPRRVCRTWTCLHCDKEKIT